MRPAAAAATLVEENDAIARGVEKPARARVAARAGTTVQENRRLARGIPAFLPVDLVTVADGQMPLAARLDGRIEAAPDVARFIQKAYSSALDLRHSGDIQQAYIKYHWMSDSRMRQIA